MKRRILYTGIIVAAALAIVQMLILGISHADRKNCVCSILTADEQTFPIDSRLYSLCEKDMLNPGTFRIVKATCAHGEKIYLCIMPDESKYTGYLLSE